MTILAAVRLLCAPGAKSTREPDMTMRKLILGAAASAFLLSGHAAVAKTAKEDTKAAKKSKLPRSGKAEDCDAGAKAALDALGQARDKLKTSDASGKAGGGFAQAQRDISSAEKAIRQGCTYASGEAGKSGAGKSTDAKETKQ